MHLFLCLPELAPCSSRPLVVLKSTFSCRHFTWRSARRAKLDFKLPSCAFFPRLQDCYGLDMLAADSCDRVSMYICRGSRSIRPLVQRNQKHADGLRSTMKLWTQENRRARQIRAPRITACERSIKHQVGNPMPAIVRQVPFLRQHVGHSSRLEGRQSFFVERLNA